jgi:K+-transporting ATPase KdpF subunit
LVYRPDRRAGATDLGWCGAFRSTAEAATTALYWIALLLTVALFGYLVYAMLKAEKF